MSIEGYELQPSSDGNDFGMLIFGITGLERDFKNESTDNLRPDYLKAITIETDKAGHVAVCKVVELDDSKD